MRYTSPVDSMLLRTGSLGPAQMSARAHRLTARAGINPTGALSGRLLRTGGSLGHLGSLGNATVKKVEGAAVSYGAKAGAASLAAYAGAGAWAGPIGAAAGLVVGLLAGKLFNKQYLNVGQMNAAEDNEVAAFQQYRQIAGSVPGRAIGLDNMTAVWRGALHSGFFPINHEKQCFHKGCSKYPGNASWVNTAVRGGSRDANTFPDVIRSFLANRGQRAQSAAVAPRAALATGGSFGVPNMGTQRIRGAFGGFGALGDANVVPDAVDFINNYFIPANQAKGNGWAVPSNAMESQILYDTADAFLATQPIQTVPYMPNASTVSQNGGLVTSATAGVYAPGGPSPVGAPPGATYTLQPVTNPNTGATSYELAPSGGSGAVVPYQTGNYPYAPIPGYALPGSPSQPGGSLVSSVTAGLSDIPLWGYALVGLSILFALARPVGPAPRRRKRS